MRSACLITKATNTHSEYVILIVFPPQQWLRERASVLRYAYSARLVKCQLLFVILRDTVMSCLLREAKCKAAVTWVVTALDIWSISSRN